MTQYQSKIFVFDEDQQQQQIQQYSHHNNKNQYQQENQQQSTINKPQQQILNFNNIDFNDQTASNNYQESNQQLNHNHNIFVFQDLDDDDDQNIIQPYQENQIKRNQKQSKTLDKDQSNLQQQTLQNMKKRILQTTKKNYPQLNLLQYNQLNTNKIDKNKLLFSQSTNLQNVGNLKKQKNTPGLNKNTINNNNFFIINQKIDKQNNQKFQKFTQKSQIQQIQQNRQSFSKRFSKTTKKSTHQQNSSLTQSQKQILSKMKIDNIDMKGVKIIASTQKSPQIQYVQQQKAIKVTNMKQFLNTQLSQQYKINAIIKKVPNQSVFDSLLNKTTYYVLIQQNNKFLFSVTKDSIGKYIFSLNKDNKSQKNKNYLGKMISKDLSNTQFIIYDDGFDPKQTKSLQFSHKQICSVKYDDYNGPRKFSTIISTNNKGFHCIQNNLDVLDYKWKIKKDRKYLNKLYSKQPQFDQTDGFFKLDFKGMIGKPSIKNFILTSQQNQNCLMFTRRTQDTYALQVKHPFSLIQAVGICISSIYHKTMF